MRNDVTLDYIKKVIQNRLDSAKELAHKAQASFSSNYADNPQYALDWADDLFTAGANLVVWQTISLWVERTVEDRIETVEQWKGIVEAIEKEMHRGARSPKKSTSPTANYADQCRTQAWAEALETLRFDGVA